MEDNVEVTRVASRRMPFTVRLDPELLVEALHRRKNGDARTLAEWIERGLRLAFTESGESVSAAGVGYAAEVALFCTLAQAAPEELVGVWFWLYERIRDKQEFWVYGGRLGGDDDDSGMHEVERYLNRGTLAAAWGTVLADAEQSMQTAHKERDARNGAHA